jgi:hypothetical protein
MSLQRTWNDIQTKYQPICFGSIPKQMWDERSKELKFKKTDNLIIVDYSSDPMMEGREYLRSLCQDFKDNFGTTVKVLSSNIFDLWNDDPYFVYFPLWYMEFVDLPSFQTSKKSYRFSFMSKRPSFHRIYFFNSVKDAVTVNDCFSARGTKVDEWEYKYMLEHIGKIDKSIENSIPFVCPNAKKSDATNHNILHEPECVDIGIDVVDVGNKHSCYDSYFNVVGETSMDVKNGFISEKTWNPIRSEVLPIHIEYPELSEALTNLGFRVRNEINCDLPFKQKINHVKSYMEKCSLADIRDIYLHHLDDVKNNVEVFHSSKLKDTFEKHIRDNLNL